MTVLPPASAKSQRTIYQASSPRRRGRTYLLLGAVVLVVALAGTAAWQFVTAPRILAVTPGPGSYHPRATVTVEVQVKGMSHLSDVVVRFDRRDVSGSVVIDGDRMTLSRKGLRDGTHTVELVAATGNLYRRHVERSWAFTVDTTAPPLAVESPKRGGLLTTTPVVFSGRSEPGASITATLDSLRASVRAGADGSFELPLQVPDGKLSVTLEAADRAGNVTTKERRLTVDTTGPSLVVSQLGTVVTAKPRVAVTTSDAVSVPSLRVSVDGATIYRGRASGTRELELGELAEGSHQITVTSSDRVGHQVTHSEVFLVDSTETLGDATLTRGAVGKDVTELQRLLKGNKLYAGDPSGTYDALTAKGVRGFQRRMRQAVTGIATPAVIAGLSGRILIDQSTCRLYFFLNGRLKFTFAVATGMPAYPTPNGVFRVVVMAKNPTWIPPDSPWAKGLEPIPPGDGNPLGTRWIGTSAPGVGIHGTPADWSIGTHASHGCIRMHVWEVEKLYDYVKVGMPVVIRW